MLTKKSYKIITRRKNGSKRVQTFNEDPSLTDQSVSAETDINNIMSQYKKTKLWPGMPGRGIYTGDQEPPIRDLTEAMIMVQDARENFMQLPSEIRLLFKNDPIAMYDWLKNPENDAQAIELGLKPSPVVKQPGGSAPQGDPVPVPTLEPSKEKAAK